MYLDVSSTKCNKSAQQMLFQLLYLPQKFCPRSIGLSKRFYSTFLLGHLNSKVPTHLIFSVYKFSIHLPYQFLYKIQAWPQGKQTKKFKRHTHSLHCTYILGTQINSILIFFYSIKCRLSFFLSGCFISIPSLPRTFNFSVSLFLL